VWGIYIKYLLSLVTSARATHMPTRWFSWQSVCVSSVVRFTAASTRIGP